jgi:hypothetical protein
MRPGPKVPQGFSIRAANRLRCCRQESRMERASRRQSRRRYSSTIRCRGGEMLVIHATTPSQLRRRVRRILKRFGSSANLPELSTNIEAEGA